MTSNLNTNPQKFVSNNKMFYDPFLFENDIGIKTPGREFYIDMGLRIGGPILELGCGTGKILIPLAKKGIYVSGLDISENMIEVFKRKIKTLPKRTRERISIHLSDMANFDLKKEFKLVIIPAHGLCHLKNYKEVILCLSNIKKHLKDDGYLVFDIPLFDINYLSQFTKTQSQFRYIGEYMINNKEIFIDQRNVYGFENDDVSSYRIKVFERTHYDMISQYLTAEFRYELITDKGNLKNVWYRTLHQRMITLEEMKAYLYLLKFKVISISGGFDKNLPIDPKLTKEVVFITKKR